MYYENMSKSASRLPQIPFDRVFSENKKRRGASFQVIFFMEFLFNEKFSIIILHKLAKFHY